MVCINHRFGGAVIGLVQYHQACQLQRCLGHNTDLPVNGFGAARVYWNGQRSCKVLLSRLNAKALWHLGRPGHRDGRSFLNGSICRFKGHVHFWHQSQICRRIARRICLECQISRLFVNCLNFHDVYHLEHNSATHSGGCIDIRAPCRAVASSVQLPLVYLLAPLCSIIVGDLYSLWQTVKECLFALVTVIVRV